MQLCFTTIASTKHRFLGEHIECAHNKVGGRRHHSRDNSSPDSQLRACSISWLRIILFEYTAHSQLLRLSDLRELFCVKTRKDGNVSSVSFSFTAAGMAETCRVRYTLDIQENNASLIFISTDVSSLFQVDRSTVGEAFRCCQEKVSVGNAMGPFLGDWLLFTSFTCVLALSILVQLKDRKKRKERGKHCIKLQTIPHRTK